MNEGMNNCYSNERRIVTQIRLSMMYPVLQEKCHQHTALESWLNSFSTILVLLTENNFLLNTACQIFFFRILS